MGRHAAAFSSEPTARARRPDAKTARQPPYLRRYAVSDTRRASMADLPDLFADNDSDDSENPFDVEIEKYEKQLQLARYRKKYRNAWPYITNRWQDAHIRMILKDIEEKWRGYADGSLEQLKTISGAFSYLEDFIRLYAPACQLDRIRSDKTQSISSSYLEDFQLIRTISMEIRLDEGQLIQFRKLLCNDIGVLSAYKEFFEEVSEAAYGREARAIYDGGMHDSTMRNARTRYGSNAELNMQFIFNNFSSSRSVRQLKLKFMSNVYSKSVPGEPSSRKLEAPDIYTLECMKLAFVGIHRNYHLPQDIWPNILPFLFRKQTLDNFKERCKVARQLKEAERVLRNFRLGYAAHYAEERRQHKFLYDVYTNFIRGLHSKHDKLHKKVKARFAQMDDLLEKFKGLPSGVKLVLSSLD